MWADYFSGSFSLLFFSHNIVTQEETAAFLIVSPADLVDAANRDVRSAATWTHGDRKRTGADLCHSPPGQKVVREHGAKVDQERQTIADKGN